MAARDPKLELVRQVYNSEGIRRMLIDPSCENRFGESGRRSGASKLSSPGLKFSTTRVYVPGRLNGPLRPVLRSRIENSNLSKRAGIIITLQMNCNCIAVLFQIAVFCYKNFPFRSL